VRLMNKQKVRGRLGEIAHEGFSLQTAQGTTVESRRLPSQMSNRSNRSKVPEPKPAMVWFMHWLESAFLLLS